MNENRTYGLEDGRSDAVAGRSPEVALDLAEPDDYQGGYIDGYRRGLDELLADAEPDADDTDGRDSASGRSAEPA